MYNARDPASHKVQQLLNNYIATHNLATILATMHQDTTGTLVVIVQAQKNEATVIDKNGCCMACLHSLSASSK